MKGIMSKAFSLALLISVVPSFAMDSKSVAEVSIMPAPEVSVSEVVVALGAPIVSTVAQNAVVNAVVPTLWERTQAAYAYVANSRVAGIASSVGSKAVGVGSAVLAAPFDYTVGLAANKSGLTAKVSGYDFVKNNSYYNQSIATAAKYVAGAAALYYAGKLAVNGVKSVYSYFTTSSEAKKAVKVTHMYDAMLALFSSIVQDAKNGSVTLVKTHTSQLKALEVLNQYGYSANTKRTVNVPAKDVKSYLEVIRGHLVLLDRTAATDAKRAASIKALETALNSIVYNVSVVFDTIAKQEAAVVAKAKVVTAPAPVKPVVKAQAEVAPSYARRACNMLFNRYTAGLAVAGAGAGYVYKYGVPFYNTTK